MFVTNLNQSKQVFFSESPLISLSLYALHFKKQSFDMTKSTWSLKCVHIMEAYLNSLREMRKKIGVVE